jgi:hypothetical protein
MSALEREEHCRVFIGCQWDGCLIAGLRTCVARQPCHCTSRVTGWRSSRTHGLLSLAAESFILVPAGGLHFFERCQLFFGFP